MSYSAFLPIRIEVFALWTGFASPPQVSGQLLLRPDEKGDWTALDEMTLARCDVPRERVVRFLNAIDDFAAEPEPVRFSRTADELDWHFGSLATDDSPTMLVELHFDDRELLRLKSSSNRVHLLPWTVEGNDRCDNFNPEISIAMSALLPDGWMFKERLHSSGSIFDSENDIRAEFAIQDEGCVDQPNETYEQQTARIHAAFNKMADAIAHGEEVDFAKGKRDYTANQLRRLSAAELSELVADGFDLSTSDETGQTALMLAAFPPFSRDQFEKLVAVGADVNARRADSMTGLMLACAGGMEDTVSYWLDAGANVNLRSSDACTAIMLGAKSPTIVQSLLKRGADVTAVDNDGDTALDYAIDDQSILRAGSRLHSIALLADEIGRIDASSLKRSLARAIEIARKSRVHRQVLMRLGLRPPSDVVLEIRQKVDQSEEHQAYLRDTDDLFDLEITEIELADRIVAILQKAVAETEP